MSKKSYSIEVDDEFFIEVDYYSHTLKRHSIVEKGDNAGKPRIVNEGYFPNIALALKTYRRLVLLNEQEDLKIEEYIEKLNKLDNSIKTREYKIIKSV